MTNYLEHHNEFNACRAIAGISLPSNDDQEVMPPLSQDSLKGAVIEADPNISKGSTDNAVQQIELNKLELKPPAFDGIKPPPRRWLDDYERAAA